MNKKKIITISIISVVVAILLLNIILFGVVFRTRHLNIVRVGEDELFEYVESEKIPLTNSKILSKAGLKKGDSTLMINKSKVATKIEQAFPYVKVIQISTTGASTVEIRLTCRYEMFYYKLNQNPFYYVLDEELKVLKITETKPENLAAINPEMQKNQGQTISSNVLNLTNNTKIGDFLGGEYGKITANLYVSMFRTVLLDEENQLNFAEGATTHYADRNEIKTLLTNIEFKTGNTLNETYTRIILTTSYGVKIDIGKPEEDLLNKVNLCFSTVNQMDKESFLKQGTVQYGYDENGEIEVVYLTQKSAD